MHKHFHRVIVLVAGLLTLAVAPCAFGTTFVSAGSCFNSDISGTATSVTCTVTTTAHHVLVASENVSANGTLTVSLTGNTLTCTDSTTTTIKTQTCYILDSVAGSNTLTCSTTVAANIGCQVAEYDMGSVPTLDTSGHNNGNSATPSVTTSGSATAADLSVPVFASDNGNLGTPTGYTLRQTVLAGFHQEYDILSLASGGTQTISTSDTSGNWTADVYIFKAGAAATCSKSIALMGVGCR